MSVGELLTDDIVKSYKITNPKILEMRYRSLSDILLNGYHSPRNGLSVEEKRDLSMMIEVNPFLSRTDLVIVGGLVTVGGGLAAKKLSEKQKIYLSKANGNIQKNYCSTLPYGYSVLTHLEKQWPDVNVRKVFDTCTIVFTTDQEGLKTYCEEFDVILKKRIIRCKTISGVVEIPVQD